MTPENRTTFVNTVVSLANEYGFDGIDLEYASSLLPSLPGRYLIFVINSWEYPGKQGDCNDYTADDSANFLQFLQEVKQAASNLTLSAAVGAMTPYQSDMSGYAEVLDYVGGLYFPFLQRRLVYPLFINSSLDGLRLLGSVSGCCKGWPERSFARRL